VHTIYDCRDPPWPLVLSSVADNSTHRFHPVTAWLCFEKWLERLSYSIYGRLVVEHGNAAELLQSFPGLIISKGGRGYKRVEDLEFGKHLAFTNHPLRDFFFSHKLAFTICVSEHHLISTPYIRS
jgi:hypothetical protein